MKKILILCIIIFQILIITGCQKKDEDNDRLEKTKKIAAENSAYGIIESAKLFWLSNLGSFENTNIIFTCSEKDNVKSCTTKGFTDNNLDISGTKPSSGIITIKDGEVTLNDLVFGEYKCNTNGYNVSCVKQ